MRHLLFALFVALLPCTANAEPRPIEVHQVLTVSGSADASVAVLTLDACDGGFDTDLIGFLIENRIAATIFATKKWLDRNAAAVALLKAHADLFDIENHGANHVPAVIGRNREVYGIHGESDIAHLKLEVMRGAAAVSAATGSPPHWYRSATGEYDPEAIKVIEAMGYKVAGFTVNADNGATLSKGRIIARIKNVKGGDIIIAHVNRPDSDTAEGLAVGLKQLLDRGFHFVKLNTVTVRPMQKRRS